MEQGKELRDPVGLLVFRSINVNVYGFDDPFPWERPLQNCDTHENSSRHSSTKLTRLCWERSSRNETPCVDCSPFNTPLPNPNMVLMRRSGDTAVSSLEFRRWPVAKLFHEPDRISENFLEVGTRTPDGLLGSLVVLSSSTFCCSSSLIAR